MNLEDMKMRNTIAPMFTKRDKGKWKLEATNSKAYVVITPEQLRYLEQFPYCWEEYPKGKGKLVARPYVGKGKQAHIHLEKFLAEAALAGATEEVKKETSINTPAIKEKVMTAADLVGKPAIKLWPLDDGTVVILRFNFNDRDASEWLANKKSSKFKHLLTAREEKAFLKELGRHRFLTPNHQNYSYWKNKILAR